jgi:hypothetical protein
MAEEFSVFASCKIRKYQVPTKKLVKFAVGTTAGQGWKSTVTEFSYLSTGFRQLH